MPPDGPATPLADLLAEALGGLAWVPGSLTIDQGALIAGGLIGAGSFLLVAQLSGAAARLARGLRRRRRRWTHAGPPGASTSRLADALAALAQSRLSLLSLATGAALGAVALPHSLLVGGGLVLLGGLSAHHYRQPPSARRQALLADEIGAFLEFFIPALSSRRDGSTAHALTQARHAAGPVLGAYLDAILTAVNLGQDAREVYQRLLVGHRDPHLTGLLVPLQMADVGRQETTLEALRALATGLQDRAEVRSTARVELRAIRVTHQFLQVAAVVFTGWVLLSDDTARFYWATPQQQSQLLFLLTLVFGGLLVFDHRIAETEQRFR